MSTRQVDERLNPFPWYHRMRAKAPVQYEAAYQTWMVFGYHDVQRVLSDAAIFSSASGGGAASSDPLDASLISIDPPRHRQLRALVTQAFTPRSVARLSERITAIATGLLDEVAAQRSMDFIDDFAYPLPMLVIAELLGVPQQDRARFKVWSDAVIGAGSMGGSSRAEMIAYFRRIMEQRLRDPQDDLISALLAAEVDGQRLTEQELLGFCILLLVAGNETTTHLLGNALLCFDDYPEALEELRADPALIPEAIEEVLRYRSPVQMMFRQAVADVELSGQRLHPGQWVVAQIGSANRDEAQFPDPDRFDMRRSPNRHLAFGHGIHFCLGAPLARLEAKIALTLLLERFREIRLDHDAALEAIGSSIVFGVKHLPIAFQA